MIIGVRIFIIGMTVTFLALGLLLLVMRLLLRVFPVRAEASEPQAAPSAALATGAQQEEMAVALAVGICLLERSGSLHPRDPTLGASLERRSY